MAGVSDIYQDLKSLNYKVIASHTTADGLRVYVNVGNKQIVKFDVSLDARDEVEALLKRRPFFACNVCYNKHKEGQ